MHHLSLNIHGDPQSPHLAIWLPGDADLNPHLSSDVAALQLTPEQINLLNSSGNWGIDPKSCSTELYYGDFRIVVVNAIPQNAAKIITDHLDYVTLDIGSPVPHAQPRNIRPFGATQPKYRMIYIPNTNNVFVIVDGMTGHKYIKCPIKSVLDLTRLAQTLVHRDVFDLICLTTYEYLTQISK